MNQVCSLCGIEKAIESFRWRKELNKHSVSCRECKWEKDRAKRRDNLKNAKVTDLPNETWREVVGYEGMYRVSSMGRVKTVYRVFCILGGRTRTIPERLLNEYLMKGYSHVMLCNVRSRKHKKVHQLVAQAFIENPDKKRTVNHINGIKEDNRVENLEWATGVEQIRHSREVLNQRRRERDISQFNIETGELIEVFRNTRHVMEKLNKPITSRAIISRACLYNKHAYGYRWEYT